MSVRARLLLRKLGAHNATWFTQNSSLPLASQRKLVTQAWLPVRIDVVSPTVRPFISIRVSLYQNNPSSLVRKPTLNRAQVISLMKQGYSFIEFGKYIKKLIKNIK